MSEDALLRVLVEVLGLLDPVTVKTIKAVLSGSTRSPNVLIDADRLKVLLDVFEEVWPGAIAHYLELRAEAAHGS